VIVSELIPQTDQRLPKKRPRRGDVVVAALAGLTLAGMVLLYYYYYPVGVAQEIPFSHRFHAGEKRIGCLVCHAHALDTPRAGLPEVETCMHCHERIIVAYPKIVELRAHYFDNVPIRWRRVNHVPEFVYFNHQVHLRRGFECGKCHGDVKGMDRVVPSPEITMGFCVQCHRDNKYSHDCLICHR
jgi:hypothetical protein